MVHKLDVCALEKENEIMSGIYGSCAKSRDEFKCVMIVCGCVYDSTNFIAYYRVALEFLRSI